jgi:hypothetical protein
LLGRRSRRLQNLSGVRQGRAAGVEHFFVFQPQPFLQVELRSSCSLQSCGVACRMALYEASIRVARML